MPAMTGVEIASLPKEARNDRGFEIATPAFGGLAITKKENFF